MPNDSAVPPIGDLLVAFVETTEQQLRQREEVARCDESAGALCEAVQLAPGPEHTVPFRQFLPLVDLALSTPSPPDLGGFVLSLGCFALPATSPEAPSAEPTTANLGFGLSYHQRWHFREQRISSPTTALSLAPGETLSVTLRNTQRKQLTQDTLDQVEQTESLESTIVDKDVLNVSRSSSKTNNWTVSGDASYSVGDFRAGIS